uniref:Zinc finger PMZ-type domain-containing protein n=1 Tax=Lactuca sativa TaxID=4236 RepID=A0A9R1XMN5_LACSA|nr:hypothetical protein LSAT_V11C400179330 [Lactuca sativa]
MMLYDFCNVPVYNERENVDDEVIREEGLSDNEIEDDEDEVDQDPTQFSVHDPSVHWKKMEPHLGEKFCLTNYAMHNGYLIKVTKFSITRLQEKCGLDNKGKRCTFKLWASWMNKEKSFQINSLTSKHICVSEGQCYRAKKKAQDILIGKLSKHCARIREYGGEIMRSNPVSTTKVGVDIKEDGRSVFRRFYVCFKAIKDGWIRGFRRVIGLDGCFLKGQCKGELLTAIGRDDNNQNKAKWLWFIEFLVEDLGLQFGEGLTIIFDQHKCARHVYANFKKGFNGIDYKRHFWAASMATTKSSFIVTMEELKEMNGSAYDHLMARNPKIYESIENGILESFNSVILEARTKPLLTMLEEIRMYDVYKALNIEGRCMSYNTGKDGVVVYKYEYSKRLFTNMCCMNYRLWGVVASETRVDLGKQSYTCRLWEISGIPCVHACVTMNHTQQQPETLISSWFSKEKFAETYKGNMMSLNGSKMWAKTPFAKPLPPSSRRMPERPKTKRRKHVTEKLRRKGITKEPARIQASPNLQRRRKKGRPVTRDETIKKQQHHLKENESANGWKSKGKAKASQPIKGMNEGYLEDEVYHVLKEQQLDVEILAEEVLEVEQVPPVPEQLPPIPQVDIVLETEDEGIADIPPSQRLLRTKRPSERIALIQTGKKVVGKKVVGPGCSRLDPVSLE